MAGTGVIGRGRGHRSPRGGGARHPIVLGVFIGLLLGLCLALAVALYLHRVNPFVSKSKPVVTGQQSQSTAAKTPDGTEPPAGLPRKSPAPAPSSEADAKRFDFYKILPGAPEPAAGGADKGPRVADKEVLYLQAGAFQQSADADNLKARLALAGLEAQIQTATLPDKSVWHRVRLGPFATPADLDRARTVLRENKIESSVVKVTERGATR